MAGCVRKVIARLYQNEYRFPRDPNEHGECGCRDEQRVRVRQSDGWTNRCSPLGWLTQHWDQLHLREPTPNLPRNIQPLVWTKPPRSSKPLNILKTPRKTKEKPRKKQQKEVKSAPKRCPMAVGCKWCQSKSNTPNGRQTSITGARTMEQERLCTQVIRASIMFTTLHQTW